MRLAVFLFSLGQTTNPLKKFRSLCLLLSYTVIKLFICNFNILYTTELCLNVEHTFISPLNDAEDDNGSAQLEEDSVDQNRAAEVQYHSISNIFPSLPLDIPNNISTSTSQLMQLNTKCTEFTFFYNNNFTLNVFRWTSVCINKRHMYSNACPIVQLKRHYTLPFELQF